MASVAGNTTRRWLYADKPLRRKDSEARDALDLGPYAAALALLIDWTATDTPLTIAINGPWGSGKSSLAAMVRYRLRFGSDWNAKHVICRFDAWAHDDAPNLGAAFAAVVAKSVNAERYPWTRFRAPLPSVMLTPVERWRRRIYLGIFTALVAVIVVFWPSGGSLLTALLHPGARLTKLGGTGVAARVAWPVVGAALITACQQLGPGIQSVANWIASPASQAALGTMSEVNEQLDRLIKQALRGKRRLVIFVDNLERCRPPRAVEVCEVVSQLIAHQQVVTVLIGDMDTIAMSAEIKYAALESVPAASGAKQPPGAFGRAYLEKLIQIQLRLPPPRLASIREMFIPAVDEPPAFPTATPRQRFLARLRERVSTFLTGRLGIAPALTAITAAVAAVDIVAGVVTFAIVLALTFVTPFFVEQEQARRQDLERDAIDAVVKERISELAAGDAGSAPRSGAAEEGSAAEQDEILAMQASAHDPRVGDIDPRAARKRMQQGIIDERLRPELDQALLEGLPRSPRAAKRMINHAHLLLAIGAERGIFEAGVSPRQLAEWVCFTERWPAVASVVADDPALMAALELLVSQPAPAGQAAEPAASLAAAGITDLDPALRDYLRHIDPLSEVAETLVNFAPPQEPGDDQPRGGQPGNAQPNHAQPNHAQPGNTQPSDAQPSDARYRERGQVIAVMEEKVVVDVIATATAIDGYE
jgi:hypothetical protein